MDRVKLPETIHGEWIWNKSLQNRMDSFLFVRREFNLDYSGMESELWITAHCSYQLFINGRFVGFGPMSNTPNTSCVDQYNVSYYLQPGANVISVLVYHHTIQSGTDLKPHGVWCQLHINEQPILWTDKNWKVFSSDCFDFGRARVAPGFEMNETVNLNSYPSGWQEPDYPGSKNWQNADLLVSTNVLGAGLKISPFLPNNCEENECFTAICKGKVKSRIASSHVNFGSVFSGYPGVYAAKSFMFSETETVLPTKVISDSPFKFFCNNRLIKSNVAGGNGKNTDAPCADSANEIITIPIKQGWNTFLFIQESTQFSMGFLLQFPQSKPDKISLLQDTIEDSPACWNIAGPLKLPLRDATPSLKFERLESKTFNSSVCNILDASSYLSTCELTKNKDPEPTLKIAAGEYILFKSEELKYGFPVFQFNGSAGDIVDISIGTYLSSTGFPTIGSKYKNTHSLYLRSGNNDFLKFKPGDCYYIMISARRAEKEIEISHAAFYDFYRVQRNESTFRCSDEELNNIWDIGKAVLHRSANYAVSDDHYNSQNSYIIDTYIQSMNMILTFGDYSLSEIKLTQFAGSQFENGDIPTLSSGTETRSQINHMFFFPVWLNFHYKTSGNEAFLTKMIPHLDLLFEFYETLLDEHTGLLTDVCAKFDLQCPLTYRALERKGVAADMNSLYCRFLLSSAEIYRSVNRPETAMHCIDIASNIALKLKDYCWDEEQKLFANFFSDGRQSAEKDALTNFLTIYSGVGEIETFEEVFFKFFNFDKPYSKVPEQTEYPYFSFLFLETLFALGQSGWGLKYLKDFWGRRIDSDAKAWKQSADSTAICALELAGGSTISPNVFLIREAVGVRVAEPGFATIYFNPAITSLTWADAQIPTIYGKLRVKWEILEDGSMDATIDAKFPLKVVPELPPELIAKSTFRLGENVILLDPESGK
jgi:hypothetical protein